MWTWHNIVGPEWRHEHNSGYSTALALSWVAGYHHSNPEEMWADTETERMYWDPENEWVVREPL